MDIKEEVRRRIADLTRFAYERGYRDGAQSALVEIESIATDDIIEQLAEVPAPPEALVEKKAIKKRPTKVTRSQTRKKKLKAASKPKTLIVQDALHSLLTAKGEARRDEVLAAAQAENPTITKFDLGNGLRTLLKQSKVRVSPDNNSVLLPMT